MKNYRLLSKGGHCPAILEEGDSHMVVVGTLLTNDEESSMKKSTGHQVADYERIVRIPNEVFFAAVDKLLTEKV